jgi:Trk K+ transport system NAD-binding subunit
VREFVHSGKTTEVAILHGGSADLGTLDTRLEEGDYLRIAIVSSYLEEFEAWLERMKKEAQA